MHRELVKELTLAIQVKKHEKAIKIVCLLGKAATQLRSFPVFLKHFIKLPTTTRGRSMEDCRLRTAWTLRGTVSWHEKAKHFIKLPVTYCGLRTAWTLRETVSWHEKAKHFIKLPVTYCRLRTAWTLRGTVSWHEKAKHFIKLPVTYCGLRTAWTLRGTVSWHEKAVRIVGVIGKVCHPKSFKWEANQNGPPYWQSCITFQTLHKNPSH